jgi:hypothetical protein
MLSSTATAQTYRVSVGHLEVVVIALDESEAIALARREFARQLPRFYDLIRSLDTNRFELNKAA